MAANNCLKMPFALKNETSEDLYGDGEANAHFESAA